jgi:hypothetical protein
MVITGYPVLYNLYLVVNNQHLVLNGHYPVLNAPCLGIDMEYPIAVTSGKSTNVKGKTS